MFSNPKPHFSLGISSKAEAYTTCFQHIIEPWTWTFIFGFTNMLDCHTVALHFILTHNKPKLINLILFGEQRLWQDLSPLKQGLIRSSGLCRVWASTAGLTENSGCNTPSQRL